MSRRKIFVYFLVLMCAVLLMGLLNLNLLQGAKFRRLSKSNCIRLIPQLGARGNILDRNGQVIAGNRISYDVMILPQEPGQVERALGMISRVLRVDTGELKAAYKNNFVSSSIPTTVAENISPQKAIVLEEYKIEEPGIIIQPKPLRDYPHGAAACHVLGYVNEIDRWRLTKLADYGYKTRDIVGFGGVEEKYDYYLRQEEGGLSVEVNHRGKFTRVLGFQPPQNGQDVRLTLDLRLQKICQDALGERKGSIILMDPQSGAILALTNYPDYNPAVFVAGRAAAINRVFNNPDSPIINRAIQSSYPPASVFKVAVASAGLESKKINLSTTFVCRGKTTIGGRKFSCWDVHGPQNLIQGIAHSCDVFFYKTGLLTGGQNIHDYAGKLGLGKSTGFDLPYETGGFIPSPIWRKINKFQQWYDGDTANLSIGQGECLATPLQLTVMMAAFANKWYLPTPYIIKAVGDHDLEPRKRRFTSVPFKRSTFDAVRKGLREVVSDSRGTANVLSSLPVVVAGKTGTAQVSRGLTHAWFVGFFPYDKPKYVICVFLENGGPGHAAAVTARRIIEKMNSQGLI